ncbi:MAG: NAD(P)/FAD-dependent oxidoreductase [Acidimicrobiia bacterium]|nr:NAD(P)/FAD-dependent oxidoreductase [Acidimicrobiia bacterium]
MKDYDVVIIGGGINGLTAAAYLAKSGLSVAVFEARGQCGTHCETIELGTPGFLQNIHATWLATAYAPAMYDLDLPGLGFEMRGTDITYAKTFLNGRNLLHAMDITQTQANWNKVSEHDAAVAMKALEYNALNLEEALEVNRRFWYGAPSEDTLGRMYRFLDGFLQHQGHGGTTGDDLLNMTGFEVLDLLFESDEVKTTTATCGWISGLPPIHRKIGALAAIFLAGIGGPMGVHTARGGSHALTHALVKATAQAGGEIWTTCPVERIVVEDGRAVGIQLSGDAMLPGETIRAKTVISNVTAVPTFIGLLGEEVIGPDIASRVKQFHYEENVLFGAYYNLSDDVEFATAEYDPGVQRAMMGYLGGETNDDLRRHNMNLVSGVIDDDIMGNWFVPTRADPSQAPEGCHTAFIWVDVPPVPRRWQGRLIEGGMDAWPELAEPLADAATDRIEQYAPGFKDKIIERFTMTPLDQVRNNASAIRANIFGGAVTPDQWYLNRPVPGVITKGASRTFIPGLYLSNSIHPISATWLATGYLAASEVAEDMGCRDQSWWTGRPWDWFMENMLNVPFNLGVGAKWLADESSAGEM